MAAGSIEPDPIDFAGYIVGEHASGSPLYIALPGSGLNFTSITMTHRQAIKASRHYINDTRQRQ